MNVPATQLQRSNPILVIEDEPSVASFVRSALERHGFSVRCAPSGAEGLKLLQTGEFAGVISDMRTPGNVNGADVHAWLRANRPALSSRLLFITGDIANDETGAILKSTGVPFIEKPFRVQQLISTVESIFGKAR
ncbi:MAG: response regulator [Terriglobales bacterium]|jgi:DNA-binding response OmpR family regulator